MRKVVHAACPHDCPDACGALITVEDGRAVRIQGDPAHPVTRGFLCAKVAKYLDRVYSAQRVLYPLRRAVPKGEGQGTFDDFLRITWDEALDQIAGRLRQMIAAHGAEAILPYSYGGTLGALGNASMDRRFFNRLGASRLERTICSAAGSAGLQSVFGRSTGTDPEQFRHSRHIIGWAENFHGNNVHLWPFVAEARRAGARLVIIDPYRTRSAALADWHLQINPGTDAALALGMMHVIIGERLYDAEYVARYTVGFEQLREKVKEYPPARAAEWTGIPATNIVQLAREYATIRPAAIRLNYGVQRSESGGMATRAICMLPCLTGSWKEDGGGLVLSTSGEFRLDKQALERPDLAPANGRTPRLVNMIELGLALNELRDPPIKALIVYNSNPAAVAPDHNQVVRGLRRPDLFTVVHEQFLTDTTDYADLVLPATTFFEHKDIQPSYGHFYLQMSEAAIAPLGECRSNVELFRALARRMGFDDTCFRESVDEMIEAALASGDVRLQGIDRQRLEREGHVRLNLGAGPYLPFAHGGFFTASGKAELYSEALKAQGLDPVAAFVPPEESRHAESTPVYPLEFLSRKSDNFLNSTFHNVESLQGMEEIGVLEIEAEDAAARGIAAGDRVRVFNARGEIVLTARISTAVRPGVVATHLNWAKLAGGMSVNSLTSQRRTDMGQGPTFYSAMVEVERAGSTAANVGAHH